MALHVVQTSNKGGGGETFSEVHLNIARQYVLKSHISMLERPVS